MIRNLLLPQQETALRDFDRAVAKSYEHALCGGENVVCACRDSAEQSTCARAGCRFCLASSALMQAQTYGVFVDQSAVKSMEGKMSENATPAEIKLLNRDLLDRVRLFLGGGYLRYQKPEVARLAVECAHDLRAGHFDATRVHKVLCALDLFEEPTANVERKDIFVALKAVAKSEKDSKVTEGGEKYMSKENFYRALYGSLPERAEVLAVRQAAKVQAFDARLEAEAARPLREHPKLEITPFQRDVLDHLTRDTGRTTCASVPIGHGKTLLSLLAPFAVLGCRNAVRYVTPNMISYYKDIYLRARADGLPVPTIVINDFGHHIKGAPSLRVLSCAHLSAPQGYSSLCTFAPDLVIVDDEDFYENNARTHRLKEYVSRPTKTRLVVWT